MILRRGNMWSDGDGQFKVFLANTCNVIRSSASYFDPVSKPRGLVMGVGSAASLRDRYPNAPTQVLEYISDRSDDYGFLWHWSWGWGIFQTKRHHRDPAVLDTIRLSTGGLLTAALMHPSHRFHLPYPGVGYGMLTPDVVYPIIKVLPDNVHVWEYGDKL